MLNFLGEFSNFDGERKRVLEVFEFVFPFEVVSLDDFPGGAELGGEFFDFDAGEGRDGAGGGEAGFFGERVHVDFNMNPEWGGVNGGAAAPPGDWGNS
jgi:hypothetical protein